MTVETISFRNIVSVLPHASPISPRPDQQRGSLKTKRDEILPAERLPKPNWIRVKAASSSGRFRDIKDIVRTNKLVTVCEEASCPNIGECWSKGTATFMIMGDKCTRRCRFCNVSTGRPDPLDANESQRLAKTIALMKLNYVVITSVDRDDLRPGADFQNSLNLLKTFKHAHPAIPTKSGLMVGLGETDEEILEVMRDLRVHQVNMLTIGQYLQPSGGHMPVRRYVHPDTFKMYEDEAYKMGFVNAASGPMVRSSYHADEQAARAGIV